MMLVVRDQTDIYVICFLIFCGGMLGYFGYQEGWKRAKVYVSSLFHGGAHFLALIFLTSHFAELNRHLGLHGVWPWFFALAIELVPIGGLFGGIIFGLNLLITCRWFNMNHNDAFSAMRLDSYRHFLRMRFGPDGNITIFPIGLETVPKRTDWEVNQAWSAHNPKEPAYRPKAEMQLKLIEDPIIVESKS